MSIKYVPGMRVEIRDEQWIIRKVELNSSYTKQRCQTLYVQGLSKFVKDIEAIFLDNIEDIKIIKPEETKLVFDSSPNFIKSRLYIESKLRKKMPTDNKLYINLSDKLKQNVINNLNWKTICKEKLKKIWYSCLITFLSTERSHGNSWLYRGFAQQFPYYR